MRGIPAQHHGISRNVGGSQSLPPVLIREASRPPRPAPPTTACSLAIGGRGGAASAPQPAGRRPRQSGRAAEQQGGSTHLDRRPRRHDEGRGHQHGVDGQVKRATVEPQEGRVLYWVAVHAVPQARRPNVRAGTTHLRRPAAVPGIIDDRLVREGNLGRPPLELGRAERPFRLLVLARRARNASGTATQCTRGKDSPSPSPPATRCARAPPPPPPPPPPPRRCHAPESPAARRAQPGRRAFALRHFMAGHHAANIGQIPATTAASNVEPPAHLAAAAAWPCVVRPARVQPHGLLLPPRVPVPTAAAAAAAQTPPRCEGQRVARRARLSVERESVFVS
eukprot:SAG25_NODE_998_length_4355_cov_10.937265_2_plen_337_part_00